MKEIAFIIAGFLGLALMAGSAPIPVVGLFDKEITVDQRVHATIVGLLETGKYQEKNLLIDASQTQSISISNGRMVFDPPIKINWKFIETTITDIAAEPDGTSILIDVDHSPIDVRVVPQ